MDSTTNSDYGSNIGSHVGMIVPTISEDEQQGNRIQGEHLSMLPRSVRWRIQLGLLQDPSAIDLDSTLETVLECNKETVMECNKVFKELVEKHVEETEEVDESSLDNIAGTNGQVLSSSSSSTPDTSKSIEVDVDPLTAIVMEKEARETRKAELYLKYRKERARRKRGLTTEARIIESESDEVDRASVS